MSLGNLPDSARVWVFLADRQFSQIEYAELGKKMDHFVSGWQTHGADLTAGYEIKNNVAVAVAVDESKTAPSGCSIDKVFRLLQEFGNENGIDFLNRMLVVKVEGSEITVLGKIQAKDAYGDGILNENTTVMNPLVGNLMEYKSAFLIAFKNHWLGKQLIDNRTV